MDLATTGRLTERDTTNLNSWAKSNTKKLTETLKVCWDSAPCPFSRAVRFLKISKQKKRTGSLPHYVITSLKQWTQNHKEYNVPLDAKQSIIDMLCDFQVSSSKELIFLFELHLPDLSLVKRHIESSYQKEDYFSVVLLINTLNLHSEEYTEHLMIPILVCNQHDWVEKYMDNCVQAQHHILSLTDHWLVHGVDTMRFRRISGVFTNAKSMKKLLTRWQEKYTTSEQSFDLPNLRRSKLLAQIKFLFYRYYSQKAISVGAMEDLVLKYIGNDMTLCEEVVSVLKYEMRDYTHAEKLQSIVSRMQSGRFYRDTIWSESEEDYANDNDYLSLGVANSCVIMINNLDDLSRCEQELHNMTGVTDNDVKPIGFDAEWATTVTSGKDALALLQLATYHKVFLIDVYCFRNAGVMQLLGAFVARLFSSERLLMIGFGCAGDMKIFNTEFVRVMPTQPKNLFDIIKVRDIDTRYNLLPSNGASNIAVGKKLVGLSKLVYDTLGKCLDKREQISDWERRPLRPKQVLYAAIDAFCLIQVYTELNRRLLDSGLSDNKSLFAIINEAEKAAKLKKSAKKSKSPQKKEKKKNINSEEAATDTSTRPSLPAKNVRVICDLMLAGLCKVLRNLGIDAVEREANKTIDHTIALATKEDRYILSSGNPYEQFRANYIPDKCVCVGQNYKSNEQAVRLINFLNIKVTETDVFSRCPVCNHDRFLILSNDQMQIVWDRQRVIQSAAARDVEAKSDDRMIRTIQTDDGKKADNSVCLRMQDLMICSDGWALTSLKLEFPLKPEVLFCCSYCGKVYWEGKHDKSIKETFKDILISE